MLGTPSKRTRFIRVTELKPPDNAALASRKLPPRDITVQFGTTSSKYVRKVRNTASMAIGLSAWRAVLGGICIVSMSAPVEAQQSRSVAALDRLIYLDIPEDSALEDALIEWGKQTSVTVMINTTIVKDQHVNAIHGTFTARQALERILSVSGLRYAEDGTRIQVIPTNTYVHSALLDQRLADATSELLKSDVVTGGDTSDSVAVSDSQSVATNVSSDSSNKLQEVVVSAERLDETVNKVPISMTALSQSTLDDLHLQTLSDIATIVPGLDLTPSGAGSQAQNEIVIRGVISGNNAATTGVYIDETPIVIRQMTSVGWSGTPEPDLFDLDRLEVLRGPQGTLFGSGAMGGAIRYVTPQPSLTLASGYTRSDISYTDGGAPSYDVGVAYGAPITEGIAAFRVSGWYRQTGGFIDLEDPYTGQIVNRNANASHTIAFRPAFTVAPVDGLTITPAVFLQRYDSEEPNQIWFSDLPDQGPDAFTSGFGAHVHQPLRTNLTVSSLSIKYRVLGMTFDSDTSYTDVSQIDFDDYSYTFPALFGDPGVDPALSNFYSYDENIGYTHAWQQEFRLSSDDPDGRLSWVTGLYYRHSIDSLTQYITPDLTPLTGDTGIPDYVQNGVQYNAYGVSIATTEQKAVFGNIAAKVVGGLKAEVGVRYENSALKNQTQTFAGPLDDVTYVVTKLPDDVEHPITPKYGVTYQITDQDMVYATAAKGYRLGGSNSLSVTQNTQCSYSASNLGYTKLPTSFKSDNLWSYEIGTKDSFFNQRLSIQASAFYIDWKGIQTTLGLNSCGQNFTTNLGRAISQGFDFQMAAIMFDGLKVSANVAYTDTYYPNATYGTADQPGDPRPLINGAGDKLPIIPWSASGVIDYSFGIDPLWRHARSYVRIDYRWLSGTPVPDANLPGYDPLNPDRGDSSYGLLNLRYGIAHEGLDVSLFVTNTTNANPRLSYGTASYPPLPPDSRPVLYAGVALPPRTYGVSASYKF